MNGAFLAPDGAKDGSFHPCFCSQPLKIKGMKAYTHEVDQREVVLDLDIRWVKTYFSLLNRFPCVTPLRCPDPCSYLGDVDIDAVVKEPITAGVKGLKVGACCAKALVLVGARQV